MSNVRTVLTQRKVASRLQEFRNWQIDRSSFLVGMILIFKCLEVIFVCLLMVFFFFNCCWFFVWCGVFVVVVVACSFCCWFS